MGYALLNGRILDGTEHMTPIDGKVLITEGDKIIEIRDEAGDLSQHVVIDLKGAYVMPGMINLHVHLPGDGKPHKKEKDTKKLVKTITSTAFLRSIALKMCLDAAKTELMSGVTTIRTVGGIINIDSAIREKINRYEAIGPRVLASNMAVSVPDGHMAGSLAYEAMSTEDAIKYVDTIAEDKPDLIKLMITGGVLDAKKKGEPGEMKMPEPYIKVACDEAHKLKLKVAAHVESPQGVKAALVNGVDTIEHGAEPDKEIIQLFLDKKASLVTTLSPALPYALFDQSVSHATDLSKYNGQVVFEGIKDCAIACLNNAVPVGLGTDTGCPFVTHYDMWRELYYFHKYCDVTNTYALHTATLKNARIVGIDNVTGSIEVGKCADILITKENPLEDLKALRTPYMVMARGRLYKKPKIKKMAEVERELDKFID